MNSFFRSGIRYQPGSSSCFWLSLLLLSGVLTGPLTSHAQRVVSAGRVILPDSIRRVEPKARVRSELTAAEAATPIHVEVALKMRNFAELERRVAAGETISRDEMAARFLPLASDHQGVARWLASQGLTVAAVGASHTMVAASGTPAQLRKAFQTSFARVAHRDAEYTAAVDSPSLPAEVESQVSSVHGLQPYLHPRKSGTIRPAVISSSVVEPPYLVGDILNAYNASGNGLTGAGQRIGVIIDTVPASSDLTKFWISNGINQSLNNIVTVNVTGGALPKTDGEETLDVSWSSGIASGAQIVIYACSDLNNVNVCYSRILDDLQDGSQPGLHQVSMSYGAGEQTDETPDDMNSVHQMFTAMSAYGVSLFASAGDDGPYADGDGIVQVCYPASDPNVTGVGGTSLYLDFSTGAVSSEPAWSPGAAGRHDNPDSSSGGGISKFFSRPSWQVGNGVQSTAMRQVPDVAFAADPNTGCYLIYQGGAKQYGGTSWSAPCWAALCALVNQARDTAGQKPLGLANTALYPLLGTGGLRDITGGDNGMYNAGAGYDLVTGLGVPSFNVLLASLKGATAPATVSVPSITSPTSTSGRTATGFSYQITASHSPTIYQATGLPAGWSVDTATGVISGVTDVAGVFAVQLSATNSAGTGTATLTVTVQSPTPGLQPPVTLTATEPHATISDGGAGEFTVTVPYPLPSDVKVYYTLGGSAVNGTDYAYLKGFVKIKAGKMSKGIQVVPQGDLGGESKKVVKLKLAAGSGYTLGTTGGVKVSIVDE